MSYSISIVATLFFLFHISCTFSPSGDNYNEEIQIPDEPIIELDLASISPDSLIPLIKPMELTFRVASENGSFERGLILLNGKEIANFFQKETTFQISPSNLNNGTHNLQIIAFFRTESGSLADQSGIEFFESSKDWNLEVDKNGGKKLPILATSVSDSGLVLTWEKYDRINFNYYSVVRRQVNSSYTPHYQTLTTIYDINNNSFVVNDIPGGDFEYRIKLSCYCENQFEYIGNWYLVNLSKSEILGYNIKNDSVTVRWSRTPIKTNFSKYSLKIRSLPPSTFQYSVFESFNINDTSATVMVPFAGSKDFIISAQNKSRNTTNGVGAFEVGSEFQPFNEKAIPYYSKISKQFFFIDPDKIIHADSISGEEFSRYAIANSKISKDFFIGIESSSNSESIIEIINQHDFSLHKKINLNSILGTTNAILDLKTAYNSEFIFVKAIDIATSETKAYLINYDSNDLVFEFSLDTPTKSDIALSRNAKYVAVGKDVYNISDENPIRTGRLPFLARVEFDNISDEHLYFIDGASSSILLILYESSTVNLLWSKRQSNFKNNFNRRFYWENGLYTAQRHSIEGLYIFDPRNNKVKNIMLNEFASSYLIYRNRFMSSNGYQANYEF